MTLRRDATPSCRRHLGRAVQVLGFLLGLLLIAWCIRKAFAGDGAAETWRLLRAAPPWMTLTLLFATLVSLAANGLMFWAVIRPVRRLPILELQWVNALASLLNYAPLPFRLGLVARVGYHWRVDRLSPTLIAAWLFAVLLCALAALGSIAIALPAVRPFGLTGLAIATTSIALAAALLVGRVARWRPIAARTRGFERMLTDPRAFPLAMGLRLVDVAAWSVRMVIAARILEVPVSAAEAALLGIAAIVASLNPLGRFGFREAAVAWLSAQLFASRLDGSELEGLFARLALVESAAEGAVTIPLGILAAFVCWRRLRAADGQS